MIIARNPVSVRRAVQTFKETYKKCGSSLTAVKVAIATELANAMMVSVCY